MDRFLSVISDIRVVVVIGAIVVLLALWLIINKLRTSRLRKELEDLESQYNKIKSVPLSFKMNKAAAISRADQSAGKKSDSASESFNRVQSELRTISDELADAEDYLLAGHLRRSGNLIEKLSPEMITAGNEVSALDHMLDDILSRENEQRQEVTVLKNRFRALKSQAEENSSRLAYNWPAVEQKISETERMFSTFEEWMYSSDFDKANAELDTIRMSMEDLDHMITTMPQLIEDARGIIPKMAETLHHDYQNARHSGVYLSHLDIEKNMNVIRNSLQVDLNQLKQGNDDGLKDHFDSYKTRIRQMDEAVKKEAEAYRGLGSGIARVNRIAEDAKKNADYVNRQIALNSEKLGLGGYEESAGKATEKLSELEEKRPAAVEPGSNMQRPATETATQLQELYQEYAGINDELKQMRSKIEAVSGGQDRAQKQIEKLEIIMNQLQVKIRRYKLPNLSETYRTDMKKGNEYLRRLNDLIQENPINMQLLNSTISEALDFIYKLYNNVNNVVGTVAMVENTIVFGNRYRSTYPDIDSELTRSELAFRNGQYTDALKIAVNAIEKIHPGNYEHMIRENAKSA